jgi:hypothetical protein
MAEDEAVQSVYALLQPEVTEQQKVQTVLEAKLASTTSRFEAEIASTTSRLEAEIALRSRLESRLERLEAEAAARSRLEAEAA